MSSQPTQPTESDEKQQQKSPGEPQQDICDSQLKQATNKQSGSDTSDSLPSRRRRLKVVGAKTESETAEQQTSATTLSEPHGHGPGAQTEEPQESPNREHEKLLQARHSQLDNLKGRTTVDVPDAAVEEAKDGPRHLLFPPGLPAAGGTTPQRSCDLETDSSDESESDLTTVSGAEQLDDQQLDSRTQQIRQELQAVGGNESPADQEQLAAPEMLVAFEQAISGRDRMVRYWCAKEDAGLIKMLPIAENW